jgi:hypothetical protein
MDVMLFLRVLWRYKWLTLGGVLLGAALAVLAYGQPSFSGGKPTIVPRGAEVWESQSELLITQPSFPYGRADEQFTGGSTGAPAVPVGDVNHMAALGPIYAALGRSDTFLRRIHKLTPVPGKVTASDVADPNTGSLLPFVLLTATAPSSTDASTLAKTAATALPAYIARDQAAAGIQPAVRVQLQIVRHGSQPQLVQGHKPTIPLLVFVAVTLAATSLAFILENARRRSEETSSVAAPSAEVAPSGALTHAPIGTAALTPTTVEMDGEPADSSVRPGARTGLLASQHRA